MYDRFGSELERGKLVVVTGTQDLEKNDNFLVDQIRFIKS
jgi:hypothetical protein